jgi:hypothetical protein
MATKRITNFFIYRWRYIVGYSVIALLLVGLLLFASLYVPGGLSPAEMSAAVSSDSLSFSDLTTLSIINLPYHMLQAG